MPLGKDVGKNIKQLKKDNVGKKKKRPKKQILAIALDAAREKGAKIKKPRKKK